MTASPGLRLSMAALSIGEKPVNIDLRVKDIESKTHMLPDQPCFLLGKSRT